MTKTKSRDRAGTIRATVVPTVERPGGVLSLTMAVYSGSADWVVDEPLSVMVLWLLRPDVAESVRQWRAASSAASDTKLFDVPELAGVKTLADVAREAVAA